MRKRALSTLDEHIEWLLKHRAFLTGKPNFQRIVTAMKYDGLVAKCTYWPDVKLKDALRQAKLRWHAKCNPR